MPTTAHGKKGVVKLDNGDGTLTDISAYLNQSGFDITQETDGDLAYGDRGDAHTVGLTENGSVNLSGPYNSTRIRHIAGIWGATATQTLEVNPAGTGTGRRKGTAETICTSVEVTCDLNGTSQMSHEHKVSGDVTWADN